MDSGLDKIEAARLDGTERHVLFDTDLVNPRAIAVDPRGGYVHNTAYSNQSFNYFLHFPFKKSKPRGKITLTSLGIF